MPKYLVIYVNFDNTQVGVIEAINPDIAKRIFLISKNSCIGSELSYFNYCNDKEYLVDYLHKIKDKDLVNSYVEAFDMDNIPVNSTLDSWSVFRPINYSEDNQVKHKLKCKLK